jgi:predicted phosphodiesterase
MIVLGDIHGDFKTITFFARKNKFKEPQNLIQVGDFGAGFSKFFLDEMEFLNNELRDSNITLYVIRGNHDDPKFFTGEYEWSNIKLLKDYTTLVIEDKKVLFVGGAISIDRLHRIENVSWWADEIFNFDEKKLVEFDGIDIVVTHNAPNFVYPQTFNHLVMSFASHDPNLLIDLTFERESINKMYQILIKKNNIEHWFYGHFHTTKSEIYDKTMFNLIGINNFYNL